MERLGTYTFSIFEALMRPDRLSKTKNNIGILSSNYD